MATVTLYKKTLQVLLKKEDTGTTTKFSISKINPESADAALLTAAQGISELQTLPVAEFRKNTIETLAE